MNKRDYIMFKEVVFSFKRLIIFTFLSRPGEQLNERLTSFFVDVPTKIRVKNLIIIITFRKYTMTANTSEG